MTRKSRRLKLSLFGVNKNEYHRFIEEFEEENNKNFIETEDKIAKARDINFSLERELRKLVKDLENQSTLQEFMEYMAEKAKSQIIPLIIKTAEVEVENIVVLGKKEEAGYNKLINELKNSLQAQSNKNPTKDKNFVVYQVEESNPLLLDVEETESPEITQENIEKIEVSIPTPIVMDESKNNLKTNSISFWGDDIEEFDVSNENSDISIENMEISVTSTAVERVVESKSEKGDKANGDRNLEESKKITSDIKNIRSKYLIDKVIGEDIMDKQGKILAKKNSIITDDIIEKVDKEGKLAELILNMTLPTIPN